MNKFSIIVPVYNAQDTLIELVNKIKSNVSNFSKKMEIILVDDYSSDDSWKIIRDLSKKNSEIIGIKLTKNCGLDTAVTAGIVKSKGDYIAIIFCDLQDPVEKLPEMFYELKKNSVDIVCAYFTNKHPESFISRLFSKVYWKLFSFFINSHYPEEEGLYRIITRRAADFYLNHSNTFKHIKILNETGLKKIHFKMKQNLRTKGKSGFTLKKKLEFAIDYITTYSFKPLLYSSFVGLLISIFSFILTLIVIILKLVSIIEVPGWTSLFVIISLFFSLLFFNLAIIAIYLSKNIEESKKSPTYFIDEIIENE